MEITRRFMLAGIAATVAIPVAGKFSNAKEVTDFLPCWGQEVSRTDYRELFNIIGTSYGAGDGETTFNLPDLRNRTAKPVVLPVSESEVPSVTLDWVISTADKTHWKTGSIFQVYAG